MVARLCTLAAAAGLAAVAAAPVQARIQTHASCTQSPYAYAGFVGDSTVTGIRATIAAVGAPQVSGGHVAGWIGVGGPGQGAGGTDAWIQVGLNTMAGHPSVIYAEAMVPGSGQAYKELGEVPVGKRVSLGVVQLPGRPGWWQATIGDRPVTKPVYLPGSHGGWQPMAVSESWNAGTPICNRFAYRFVGVRVLTRRGWRPFGVGATLTDAGYRVTGRPSSSFVARSTS